VARIVTIGVYGFSLETFISRLAGANVELLLDIRQRRAVRGATYSWANAARLQDALANAGIHYRHVKELAPSTELRQLQYQEDDRQGVGKRNRAVLAEDYIARYTREILAPFDLASFVADLPDDGATALLCVEREPAACHRSLVAERLQVELGWRITHLCPPPAVPGN
jgi:uncharacterized protein (DUF488 family)